MSRKRRPGEDQEYLELIRQQPCVVCGRRPCDPHHQPKVGHGSMGMKCEDLRALPLCRGPWGHHTGRGTDQLPGSVHSKGRGWLESMGVDIEAAIRRLNGKLRPGCLGGQA